jgi:hypothetical protein
MEHIAERHENPFEIPPLLIPFRRGKRREQQVLRRLDQMRNRRGHLRESLAKRSSPHNSRRLSHFGYANTRNYYVLHRTKGLLRGLRLAPPLAISGALKRMLLLILFRRSGRTRTSQISFSRSTISL